MVDQHPETQFIKRYPEGQHSVIMLRTELPDIANSIK